MDVYETKDSATVLFRLLGERAQVESISHRRMPTWSEHRAFVRSRPYRAWYLIEAASEFVGAIYLSKAKEIGLFIFRKYRRKGYGYAAIHLLIHRHRLRKFYINLNPRNRAGLSLIHRLRGQHIQSTYQVTAQAARQRRVLTVGY